MRAVLILFLFILPALTSAQDEVLIDVNAESINLDRCLRRVQKTYDIQLAYNSKLFRKFNVDDEFKALPASVGLRRLAQPFDYDVKRIGEVYVFFPAKKVVEQVNPEKENFDWSSYVVDDVSGEKLPFAIVQIASTGQSAQCDADGYFVLSEVPSDTCSLKVSYVGYEITRVQLNPEMVRENQPIKLHRNLNVISKVPVLAYKAPISEMPNEDMLRSWDVEGARILPGLGENDVFSLIQMGTGINGTNERAGSIHLRGGDSDETLVSFDGFTVYHTDHFYNLFSAINSSAIKHVRVHQGHMNPEYGGRASGMIEITGKEGNENYSEQEVDLNFTSISAFVQRPLADNKSTLAISARRSYTDVLFSPLYKDLFNNIYDESVGSGANQDSFDTDEQPDFHFTDVNLKYTYKLNPKNKLNLSLYLAEDQLNIRYRFVSQQSPEVSTYLDESHWGNRGLGFRWNRNWSQNFKSQLIVGLSQFESDLFALDFISNEFTAEEDTIRENRNNDLRDVSIRFHNSLYTKNHKLSFGFNYVGNNITYKEISESSSFTIDEEQGGVYSMYLQDELIWRRLKLQGGIRLNYADLPQEFNAEPRIMASFKVSNGMTVFTSYNRHHQYIRRLSEQNLFLNTADVWALSNNTRIPILRSDQLATGFSLRFDRSEFKTEAYQRWMDGALIDVSLIPQTFGQSSGFSTGERNVRGIDMVWNKWSGMHKGWIGLTLAQIKNTNHDIIQYEFPSSHDQLMELKTAYSIRLKGWSLAANFVYGSGRPFSPAVGVYELQLINEETRNAIVYSDLNSERLPPYHRLDFALTKHLNWSRVNQAEVGLSIFNIYNRINQRDVRYFYSENEGGEATLQAYNIDMLGVVPSLKIKINF